MLEYRHLTHLSENTILPVSDEDKSQKDSSQKTRSNECLGELIFGNWNNCTTAFQFCSSQDLESSFQTATICLILCASAWLFPIQNRVLMIVENLELLFDIDFRFAFLQLKIVFGAPFAFSARNYALMNDNLFRFLVFVYSFLWIMLLARNNGIFLCIYRTCFVWTEYLFAFR